MGAMISLIAVLVIILAALVGSMAGLQYVFGVILPYTGFTILLVGFVFRVLDWAKSPVPFRIPTTAGQEFSLPWIKQAKLDNPSTTMGVLGRMAFEILAFRSLFRNTKAELRSGNLIYGPAKWLWLFALAFHWAFFIIAVRHLRLFMVPVPGFVEWLDKLDSIMQIGTPPLYITDVLLIAGVTFLLLRRLMSPRIRYISLPADYFPLFLILAIATTGILMRFFIRTDIVGVKEILVGLATFHPVMPDGIGPIFFIHATLVSVLMAYFPFSKLMHLGGVFLSPTRNMANNNRMVRHVNPWNYPVKIHTYDEYEDEFRDLMKGAGIPVERE
ncbi:sulfate reduction electron transfer complex DsrMKJOP subunit DsrM [Dissulfurimicrobium hydrothermale]|uniref:sulfate reduction electron transfer complex DsrMKJOP subunit DsrM n=1 Tax=Dissulfurimicrobium hydrothermale TaxID=1750598 RepID=UPI001EDC1BCA|nr:sulfate reduction electron transfer complex DsrMKJOP subunit DsrM [Dissulfurimicrobium hydrothermale]UKL13883.1 sulfate reduction electron transfer complex DsrMKJOP subunit DsrM [Dissulfurimicrobium hydrothermale]